MAPLADSDSINKGEAELLPRDAWKTKYIEYYTTNAPTKVAMVTDEMMDKWDGRYDTLWANLLKKYGPPGEPIEQPPPPAARTAPPPLRGKGAPRPTPGGGGGGKRSIAEFHDEVRNDVSHKD